MKYIIGLGNPGLKYRNTKHNIGFKVVERIAKEDNIKIDRKLYSSLLGRGAIKGEAVTLVLPQTYMNLSGKAIGQLYKKELKGIIEDLIVICDDINLKLGRVRLRKRGSSGGHKGLDSIMKALGRDDFARLRVGIATETPRADITNYVLTPFRRKESKNVSHAITLAKDACIAFIEKGVEQAMSKFNPMKISHFL